MHVSARLRRPEQATAARAASLPPRAASMAAEQHKTVIVGGGPAGLLAACLLAKGGESVVVFDGHAAPTENTFSHFPVLNLRGQAALKELSDDLFEAVEAVGRRVDYFEIVLKNKTFAKMPTLRTSVKRNLVVMLLVEEAKKLGVQIRWNHKLVDIDVHTRTCVFQQDDGTRPDLLVRVLHSLIGADGNYSTVRHICEAKAGLKVDVERWGVKMHYVELPPSAKSDTQLDGAVHYIFGEDGYAFMQPNGNWNLVLSSRYNNHEWEMADGEGLEDVGRRLKAHVESNIQCMVPIFEGASVRYEDLLTNRSFDGSIVHCATLAPLSWIALVGDSAHAVAPFVGEGINSSLESACVLARVLLRGDTCADFDTERRQDAHALWEMACTYRKDVVPSTSLEKFMTTFYKIATGIATRCGVIEGNLSAFRPASRSVRVTSYSELTAIDKRRRCVIEPLGKALFYMTC